MYKIQFHRFIWFPYRPEYRFLSPVLIILLIIVASAGIVKGIDIFTVIHGPQDTASRVVLIILLFALSFLICLVSARSDYLSFRAAAFPCMISVISINALVLLFISFKSDFGAAALQAGVSTFATFALVGRFVQSGGIDLGNLGSLRRSTYVLAQAILRTEIGSTFTLLRAQLTEKLEALGKTVREAAGQISRDNHWIVLSETLDEFATRGKMVDDGDYREDVRNSLIDTLVALDEG